MADYISREEVLYQIEQRERFMVGDKTISVDALRSFIKNRPAADVEPVRHGRWGKKQGGFWEFAACSLCGEKTPTAGIAPNYCPNCGAKMNLEEKENA